jgi:hypothetical protein
VQEGDRRERPPRRDRRLGEERATTGKRRGHAGYCVAGVSHCSCSGPVCQRWLWVLPGCVAARWGLAAKAMTKAKAADVV